MSTTDRRSGVRVVTRPSLGRVAALIALTWGIAIACVLTVAADTRLGPVVFRVTRNHGVHLGDVYATLGCACLAILVSVWIVVDHMGRKRRWARARRRVAHEERVADQEPEDVAETGAYDEYEYDYDHDVADPDLVETTLIERDDDDLGGRHRQRR